MAYDDATHRSFLTRLPDDRRADQDIAAEKAALDAVAREVAPPHRDEIRRLWHELRAASDRLERTLTDLDR
ncbi:MAG: hypothetical protein ACFBSD_14520 [Paracoccaceae bacterium]